MKVLHVINTLSAGGAELHLLTLCRYLKHRGTDLRVAYLREEVKGSRSLLQDFEKENIPVFNLAADSRYNIGFLNRMKHLVEQERPDILHTHLPRADIGAAFMSHRFKSQVLLCSVHGIYRDRWFGSWAAPLMRQAYRTADATIAISSAVKDWLQSDLGVRGDKIHVIHYGIEPNRFAHSSTGANQTKKPGGAAVVGSIGRLEPGKGFDCLIEAIKRVREQMFDASLWIAGHDPSGYGRQLESLIATQNMVEHIRLLGFCEDISAFLNSIDVFAFASRSEGFGQVVIEAMAAGKPVVASRIGPLTEIIRDRENGFLVNPNNAQAFADAIVWLLTHPQEAEQMGRRGQERVYDCFSADRMAHDTSSLYKRLLRSSHSEFANVS